MDVSNHTPSNHVRVTIIDDSNDVLCDTTTKYALVKDVGIHIGYVVFEKEIAFPSNVRGLRSHHFHGWEIVVTDSGGTIHSGTITNAEALEIRFHK